MCLSHASVAVSATMSVCRPDMSAGEPRYDDDMERALHVFLDPVFGNLPCGGMVTHSFPVRDCLWHIQALEVVA